MAPPDSILIIEDHPLMSHAVGAIVQQFAPTARIRAARSIAAGLEMLDSAPVDLIVLDLGLSDTIGFSGLETLRRQFPDIPVVVNSGSVDSLTVLRAINAGACGFIPKTFDGEAFLDAFRTILSGNVYVPPLMFERNFPGQSIVPSLRTQRTLDDLELSPRQVEILGLIITGLSNKLICRRLDIAEGTVKAHVSAILSKLGTRNRAEVLIVVSQIGWPQIAQRYGYRHSLGSRKPAADEPDSPT